MGSRNHHTTHNEYVLGAPISETRAYSVRGAPPTRSPGISRAGSLVRFCAAFCGTSAERCGDLPRLLASCPESVTEVCGDGDSTQRYPPRASPDKKRQKLQRDICVRHAGEMGSQNHQTTNNEHVRGVQFLRHIPNMISLSLKRGIAKGECTTQGYVLSHLKVT